MAAAVEDKVIELKDEVQRKEDFVANFTHELKTPLTSVIGYAEMLSSQNLSEEERAIAANYIFKEGLRLEAMSMKLFDLILLDREGLELKAVYVPDLMDSIRESVEPLITGDEKQLMVRPVPAYIRGDGTLLKTVFINMLDNARKALSDGGEVVVSVETTDEGCTLCVEDNGPGIPAESLERLTEAFYRVDKSHSREIGGTGLGLAITRNAIVMHRGAIKVKSEEHKGTTFSVRIPLTYIA